MVSMGFGVAWIRVTFIGFFLLHFSVDTAIADRLAVPSECNSARLIIGAGAAQTPLPALLTLVQSYFITLSKSCSYKALYKFLSTSASETAFVTSVS